MDTIALIIGIIVASLIPVAMGAILIAEKRANRTPAGVEVAELFSILIVYAVFAWLIVTAVTGIIYGIIHSQV